MLGDRGTGVGVVTVRREAKARRGGPVATKDERAPRRLLLAAARADSPGRGFEEGWS
jgi:hypothetical protein